MTTLSPMRVFDADSYEWHTVRETPYGAAVLAWMEDQGITTKITRHVEVYLVDTPYAVVVEVVTDEGGRIIADETGDGPLTRTRTVLLSSLPPERNAA